MQPKVWRCRICGEPLISTERPDCPFCGAHKEYMIAADRWKYADDIKLSEKSRKNVEQALELEKSNTAFYICVSNTSESEFIRTMFRALARVEAQHASLFARILKPGSPKESRQDTCTPVDRDSVQESLQREITAVASYGKFVGETKEPRLKEIFQALVEIEGDHIALDREVLKGMTVG